MTTVDAFLASWDRQCACVGSLLDLLTPELARAKPSPDGWPVSEHLCHVHLVRLFWLRQVGGRRPAGALSFWETEEWKPTADLAVVRAQLALSQAALREWLEENLEKPDPVGGYDHPALFLQHMVWHEGWHVGLIMLALRLAGAEPSDEWEEANLWGRWRVE